MERCVRLVEPRKPAVLKTFRVTEYPEGEKPYRRDAMPDEVKERNAARMKSYAEALERHRSRVEAGVIGECRHCGINVWGDGLPVLPCEVDGCPYE